MKVGRHDLLGLVVMVLVDGTHSELDLLTPTWEGGFPWWLDDRNRGRG
jgi:hypothetical protein